MKNFIEVTGHDDGNEYILALSTLLRVENSLQNDTPVQLTIADGAYRGGSFTLAIREGLSTVANRITEAQQSA